MNAKTLDEAKGIALDGLRIGRFHKAQILNEEGVLKLEFSGRRASRLPKV
ncbi:hypothetical protein [Croceicoccus mobilis]|nr:hypothetical protein [Croceicoccus mobilis]